MSVAVDNKEKNSAWLIRVNRTGQTIYGRNFASQMCGQTGYKQKTCNLFCNIQC